MTTEPTVPDYSHLQCPWPDCQFPIPRAREGRNLKIKRRCTRCSMWMKMVGNIYMRLDSKGKVIEEPPVELGAKPVLIRDTAFHLPSPLVCPKCWRDDGTSYSDSGVAECKCGWVSDISIQSIPANPDAVVGSQRVTPKSAAQVNAESRQAAQSLSDVTQKPKPDPWDVS